MGAAKNNRDAEMVRRTNNERFDCAAQLRTAARVACGAFAPRAVCLTIVSTAATRAQVRALMRSVAGEYETETALVEAVNCTLELPAGAMDDPDHWVWDEAFKALESWEKAHG